MTATLLTGATSFLGYHVARCLNQAGVRPRVLELPGSAVGVLDRLDVDRCAGHLADEAATRAACAGVDTLLHLAYKVSVGGGPALIDEMRLVNIEGTRRLLLTAARRGVRRAVVVGSALGVGVNREPAALDESADWARHAFDIPYANIRRQAERDALALAEAGFAVTSVCPSLTFGPDDPTGAPANKLLQALVSGKLRFSVAVGFGCLDVRDFAYGVLRAAERGRSGERYLLSGENVTLNQLLAQGAAIAGVRAPRRVLPAPLLRALVGALELVSAVRRRPAPLTRDVLQILGRYAWYDTSRARLELGWTSRPLSQTLEDTIRWLRDPSPPAAARAVD